MLEVVTDPRSPSCYFLLSGNGVQESQQLGPDPVLYPARDARGRFAKGNSGNPWGRPRGIPNPRRRVADLVARPLSPQALSALLDRKPHLLRPLAAQVLPPPLAARGVAERLGIDLSSVRTVEHLRKVLSAVLEAVARGEIAPAEAAQTAKRVTARLPALRRLPRLAPVRG
jgi:hypothetical protein